MGSGLKFLVAGVVGVALAVSACESTQTPKGSGFLGNYGQLRADPANSNRWRFVKEKSDLGEYEKIHAGPRRHLVRAARRI